jgi:molybdopterin guanine dinucleotide-containing S/N-oxide reductase-like protein
MVDNNRFKKAAEEKTFVKGFGFISQAADGNVTAVDVKDGKIVRLRPFPYDWKYDPKEYGEWEIKARGSSFKASKKSLLAPYILAYKKRCYSSTRILYPLKRVDWDPKGDRHPETRGTSKFVRISWDEALDIIVNEIRRVNKKYGAYTIFSQSDGHGENKTVHGPHGCHRKLLDLLGGYTQQVRNPDSWEGWYWGAKHVWGMEPVGQMKPQSNIVPDIARNTDMLLYWGADPETTPWGWAGQTPSLLMSWFEKELGIKSIFICPDLNYACAIHAHKWIPILPNTDAALQLAIAYQWFTAGDYDEEYLKTHSVGWEKCRDYILGKEDGIPKTPKWAEELTAIPSRIIKALARDWAEKTVSIIHCNGGGMIRGPYATEPARLEILLLAMRGLGKPGVHHFKMIEQGLFGDQMEMAVPRSIFIPDVHAAYTGWGLEKSKQIIPKDMAHDAILNPPISWYGGMMLFEQPGWQVKKTTYPAPGCPEVHMIWTDSPCWITCWNGGNDFIKALQSPKIEFILAQHPWMENDCLFADIILPVNTKFEEEDLGVDGVGYNYRVLNYEAKCIEPLGESRSDYDIVCLIAEKLGLLQEYTGGRSIEDLIKFGFDHCGGADKYISYEKWKENGYWIAPTDPEWEKYPKGMEEFYKDPENHKLTTPSGKLEFYSETLATTFPDDEERPPYPKWIPYGKSHQESQLCERAKKYPLLTVSNHPRWGVHANHEDITWIREIPTCKIRGPDGYQYHPVWLNPQDAADRGIVNGDIVKVFNERGAILCGAYVNERIIRGAISIDHGSKFDPIVLGELDRGGAINTIVPHNVTSKYSTGMTTCGFLAQVERVNLDDLRKKYPEAFNRPFHPFAGTGVESFLYGGEK